MNKDMELKLKITADGKIAVAEVNQLDSSLKRAGTDASTATKQMRDGMAGANKEAQALSRQVGDLTNQTRSLVTASNQTGRMLGGILSVGTAAVLARDILNTNRSMEMLRAQLTSLTGSMQASRATFQFIQDFATNTPFEIDGLTKAYISLQNYGIRPTRDVMQAITDQASKLGGSQETLQGITIALGQAYAKGKLQAEEMMQLAERGVPVYDLLAQVTSKNTSELFEMAQQGELTRDVIDKLISKMGEMAKGGNANAMDTLNGKISNLADAWHSFEDALLQDRSEGLIKGIVGSITNSLNILRRNMSTAIDDQIAHIEARIKNYNQGGALAKGMADYTGYDINLEKNRLDALKRQKAAETEAAAAADIRAKSLKAVAETEAWLSDIDSGDKAAAKSAAKKRATAAEHAAQTALNKAKQEAARIEERYQQLRDQARTGDQVFIDTVAEYTKAYNTRNISLQQYIMLLAKADDARDKSAQKANPAVPAVPRFYEGGMSQASYDAANSAVNADLSAAARGAEEYDRWLGSIDDRLSRMSDVSGAVFDSQLGGISAVAGAFENLQEKMAGYAATLAEIQDKSREYAKDETDNAKQLAQLKVRETQLNENMAASQLEGIRRLTGATANMFAEGTKGRQTMHAVEMALGAIEMAQKLGMLSVDGAAATLNQGKGDPYTAFARMAAMAALVASIMSSVKGIGGSSTVRVGGAATSQAPTSGTVLGDPSAKSESINNTYRLLQDIHAKEYRELRGINSGVAALQTGITDSITKLFQSGGLKTPNIAAFSGVTGMASTMKSVLDGLSWFWPVGKLPIISGIMNGITNFIIGGLFGKTTRSVTGGGIYVGGTSLAELLAGGQISGQQYTEITTTKKSWFSKKTTVSEILSALDPEFQSALSKMFRGMATSMMSMANEFGKDMTDAVNKYVIPGLKISLYGMTSDQMISTLNNVLSTQLDVMTTNIFGSLIAKYQKLGEGMFETATRLVAEKAVVLDAINLTGKTFSGDAVAMADGLVTLAGGIKEFQGLFQDYYRNFYSEAEQLANTTRRLKLSLSDYGLELPDTRQAYRDLVDAQNLDTEAGRVRYNQLLQLADAADTYYKANEKLRESMELLSKDTFATAVDYTRYLRLAQLAGISKADDLLPPTPDKVFMPTGAANQTLPGINSGTTVSSAFTTVAESNQAVSDEVRQLRTELQAQNIAIAQNTADVAKLLKRWDGNGLPETRAIA